MSFISAFLRLFFKRKLRFIYNPAEYLFGFQADLVSYAFSQILAALLQFLSGLQLSLGDASVMCVFGADAFFLSAAASKQRFEYANSEHKRRGYGGKASEHGG